MPKRRRDPPALVWAAVAGATKAFNPKLPQGEMLGEGFAAQAEVPCDIAYGDYLNMLHRCSQCSIEVMYII